ncbi:MAG: acetyltransferase [Anaerocolumna sp.]|jgi:ribosomal protein S18 acetylase RimI-like enzyme|nr:acetyltransferase [Anaerocolumna sp.]
MNLSDTDLYHITLGTSDDIDELENLYNVLNDSLQEGTNYPGWKKGIYPIRETAESGIATKTLYVLKIQNEIAGTIILNHHPEDAYKNAPWGIVADYNDIIVIHTFAVHPKFMGKGVGKSLLEFAIQHGIENKMKSIRLDVSIHNTPAISLYEKCGFQYVGFVSIV